MSLGSFFHSVGNSMGFGSDYDQAGNDANLLNYSNAIQGSQNEFDQATSQFQAANQTTGLTNYMAGAQNAYQQQQANYGQQQGAAAMLYNQATGQVASPADIQMQSGLANANNQAQSAAFSQQGGVSPGLTQRNMLNSQAQQNAGIVNQGAAMRAQETQAAQQSYANMLGQMGQTSANMTNQQQNMGQFQYNQSNTANQQALAAAQARGQFDQGGATSTYSAGYNQLGQKAGYQSQQDVRAGATLGAFANAILPSK